MSGIDVPTEVYEALKVPEDERDGLLRRELAVSRYREDYRSFGVTGEVIAGVAESDLDALEAVERVAMPDVPIPYARPLEEAVLPDSDDVEAAVGNVVE